MSYLQDRLNEIKLGLPPIVINPRPQVGPAKAKTRREYHREYQRQLRQCPHQSQKIRERNIRSKYGLTIDEYREMHAKQKGQCAICQTPIAQAWQSGAMSGANKGPRKGLAAIDHCHKTSRVRALLCSPCNAALGNLRDDPTIMRKAARYVERYARRASH